MIAVAAIVHFLLGRSARTWRALLAWSTVIALSALVTMRGNIWIALAVFSAPAVGVLLGFATDKAAARFARRGDVR